MPPSLKVKFQLTLLRTRYTQSKRFGCDSPLTSDQLVGTWDGVWFLVPVLCHLCYVFTGRPWPTLAEEVQDKMKMEVSGAVIKAPIIPWP